MANKPRKHSTAHIIAIILPIIMAVSAVAASTNDSEWVLAPHNPTEPVNITEPVPDETHSSPSPLTTEPVVTEPKNPVPTKYEKYPVVPHYYQTDYPDTPYGNFGTVSTHGCGIASLAMVSTYLLDKELPPDVLAGIYGEEYNTTVGSKWVLFDDSAKDMGLTIVLKTWDVRKVAKELKKGSVAVACCGEDSIFTDGGHFIVITGITEDGKFLVQDPYIGNYTAGKPELDEGFANGFAQRYFWACHPIWVYAPKGQNDIDLHPENYEESFIHDYT